MVSKYSRALAFWLGCLVGLSGWIRAAEDSGLTLRFVGTEAPSSFAKVMWVRFSNPAFTPVNLSDMMAAAALIIDGKQFPRTAPPFDGPPGIAPKGDWEDCFAVSDFTPAMTAGKHNVSLKMGETQSADVSLEWFEPVVWQKGTVKTRLKEIRALASALKPGMPRACVEMWLTEKDGGVQNLRRVRYFLEPFIKMVVPYTKTGGPGQEHDVVGGPVQVYQENRLTD